MTLLQLEFKKMFFNRKKIIVLSLLFVFYLIIGFTNTFATYGGITNYNIYVQLVNGHTGKVEVSQAEKSNEIYTKAKQTYGSGDALDEMMRTDPEMKFNVEYSKFATAVNEYWDGPVTQDNINNLEGVNPIKNKLEELKSEGKQDSYEYRKYENKLKNLESIGEPEFKNVSVWNNLFSAWGGMYILLLLLFPIAFFMAPIYTQEVKTGMNNIILSSQKGRKEIVGVKVITSIITSAIISILYLAGTFVGTIVSSGSLPSAASTINCLTDFRNTPYNITIISLFFISVVWIVLVSIVFGIFSMAVSSAMKSQSSAFAVSFIILLLGMATNILGSGVKKIIWPIVDFSFSNLSDLVTVFGDEKNYNFFGTPIAFLPSAIVVILVMTAAMILFLYKKQNKRVIA